MAQSIHLDIPHVQQPLGSAMCGAACLEMVYSTFGISLPTEQIWPAISEYYQESDRSICRSYLMARHACSQGFNCVVVSCKNTSELLNTCLHNDIRVIALGGFSNDPHWGHYCVVTGIDQDGVYLNDPELPIQQGKDRFISHNLFSKLIAPSSNPEVQTQNTFLLIADAASKVVPFTAVCPNGHYPDINLFSVITDLNPLVLCLDCDRWFSSLF